MEVPKIRSHRSQITIVRRPLREPNTCARHHRGGVIRYPSIYDSFLRCVSTHWMGFCSIACLADSTFVLKHLASVIRDARTIRSEEAGLMSAIDVLDDNSFNHGLKAR